MLSINSLIKAWDDFFFKPQPTEGVAIFRVVWCLILFAYLIFDLPNIQDFYGPNAILAHETVKSQFNYLQLNVFNFIGVSETTVYGLIFVYGIALLLGLLGVFTRTSLIIALVCMTSLHQRNIWLLSSSELLMRTITILLICSPCGHALSLDSKWFKKERDWAPWALRLIQIQVSVVYLWTVWHKLKGDTWFDGSAVYYATRLEGLVNFPLPYVLDSKWCLRLATWSTLFIELGLGILVWFKETRRPMIILGILFHLGIEYLMSIPFFEIIMISLILNFFTPQEYRMFVNSYLLNLRERLRLRAVQEGLAES